jgi:hypothetical protein
MLSLAGQMWKAIAVVALFLFLFLRPPKTRLPVQIRRKRIVNAFLFDIFHNLMPDLLDAFKIDKAGNPCCHDNAQKPNEKKNKMYYVAIRRTVL